VAKPAAKTAPQAERKNECIQARVTATERKQFEQVAARQQLSMSEAARQLIVRAVAEEG
jgi:hypothetical protein